MLICLSRKLREIFVLGHGDQIFLPGKVPYGLIACGFQVEVKDMPAVNAVGGQKAGQGGGQLVVHQQLHAAIRMG